ncbi:YfhO family protein [Paraflavisolibacter sp. H34]|uniref:YfhO family protein n=1 Tax=Huijunlia imazamoxiresistens TaxID=3127457 RepID=UPI00301A117F
MKKGFFQKALPHIVAVVIFLIVAVLYCKPVLEGKVVNQHDVLGWKGMAQQSIEYKERTGHFPLWTNSLFSGMPAYTVAFEPAMNPPTLYLTYLLNFGLPKPISFFLLSCICFYFLSQILRVNPWIGILSALAYTYATYDPIIVAVGHDTKMQAMGLMPAVIGSLLLLFQRRYWWGLALLSIFFSFQVATQHLQIIYYTGIIMGFMVLAFAVYSSKKGELAHVGKAVAGAALACALGFFMFASNMLPLREYAQETMRGGRSELTAGGDAQNKTKGGLDKDYAFNWSYGISETFTLVVPGIYGGSNGGDEHKGATKFSEKLGEVGVPEDQAVQMANSYSYWGDQPSTSGPVYLGAVICFLFILGMVYLKSWHKWWIIAATVFGILLSWGKNFAAFNYFLFDYLPLYNKFRAPSMALVIPQFTFAVTAALALQQVLFGGEKREALWKQFKVSLYITGGLVALLGVLYISFNYKSANDSQIQDYFTSAMTQGAQQPSPQALQQAQTFSQGLMTALHEDRQSLFGSDLLRSVLFIALAALLVAGFLKDRLKALHVLIGLTLLTLIDLMPVGRRYLNEDKYVEKEQFEASFTPTQADQQIMADAAKPFRVFDQTDPQGPFNGSRASYFHNSVGGYHPAKLGLYQDLIEHQISKGNMKVFNMLNTKYFITPGGQGGQAQAQLNPEAFGPAWLVKAVRTVANADAEMAALANVSKDTAIVQQKFAGQLKPLSGFDSTASLVVARHSNDTVSYRFTGKQDAFAVFSEIYYPLGWNAYIDGKKAEYVKTDYVLRGMNLPAGTHTVDFIFEPASYKTGNTLSLIASVITLLLLAAAIFFEVKRSRRTTVLS